MKSEIYMLTSRGLLESDVEDCTKVNDSLVKQVASTLEKYMIILKGVCRDNKHT